jgi:alpha-beta hydrolase superfamily lysophospholipase
MIRKSLRWVGSHRKTSVGLALLGCFVLLNVVAYLHAHAMTHYVPAGVKTAAPESLSALEKVKVLLTGVTVPRPSDNGADPKAVGLPYEVHRIQGPGEVVLAAWYVPHAQARGLVLLFHGHASSKACLLSEGKVLHDLGYALFLVDFQGSGGSSGNKSTIGMREADDVALAVAYAKERWGEQPLILYGRSMGSVAILRAAAVLGLRPQAVILECPFDGLVSTVANRLRTMGLPSWPFAELLVFWGGVQHGFNGFTHNPVEYARHVPCPTLLLHGDRDARVTLPQAEAVFRSLPEPRQFVRFAGVGHESYLALHPQTWHEEVSGFLTRYGAPGSSSTK